MPKQQNIPGTEHKTIKAIRDAAEAYVEIRDKRMKLTMKEVEARGLLEGKMQEHGLKIYRDEDAELEVLITEKVKVRRLGGETAAPEKE